MPVTLSYPGVYVEELPSGVHTIVGVSTSNTAFIGTAQRGPVDTPVSIQGMADFDRIFGGLWRPSALSYAVRDFFLNGGSQAFIVRIVRATDATAANNAATATINSAGAGVNALKLSAKSPGAWGNQLSVKIDFDGVADQANFYNLTVLDQGANIQERYTNISINTDSARSLYRALDRSYLVAVAKDAAPTKVPAAATLDADKDAQNNYIGKDGSDITPADYIGDATHKYEAEKKGLYALRKFQVELFNLLCIPPIKPDTTKDLMQAILSPALALCVEKRAMLIVDPPKEWDSVDSVVADMADPFIAGDDARNAAVFFPRLLQPDPLDDNRVHTFAPCGAVAGVFARTDAQRGVWKAPAGIDASLAGVPNLGIVNDDPQQAILRMTDPENGRLNPLGVNCLRSFPIVGRVVWGARTMRGADALANDWKYIPVRRTALYIEESLYRGLSWAVFEPNDEPLWSQIRLAAGAFMQDLFRQGAFQGSSPKEAYFVKCDKETTTQNDINLGIVNVVVGFAPLKPAEFVVLRIQQIAGQVQT